MNPWRDRVLALAGVLQAARLVQDIAWRGQWDEDAARASLGSVMRLDAGTTDAVFGGRDGVQLGLRAFHDQITNRHGRRDVELLRYTVALMHLERRFMRRADLLWTVREGIRVIAETRDGLPVEHADVVQCLAELYRSTLSTVPPRILVNGDPGILHNERQAARIRALLLAGLRAAVLWRQLGGRRWQLLFQQDRLARTSHALLNEPASPAPADEDRA